VAGVTETNAEMVTALHLPPTVSRTDYTPPPRRNLGALETTAQVKYLRDEEYLPALLHLIQTAKQSLIGTVYVFSEQKTDAPCQEQVVNALIQAARRGVYVYLVLHTPDETTDRLNEQHSAWAERLRREGLDIRLAHPTIPMHAKLLVADQSKILLGSHNWSEGSLSGKRVYESSVLVVLEEPDVRLAELILDLPILSDMRSRELWEAERDRIRILSRTKSGSKDDLLQEWGVEP
jgi:phosphatidylserine/phosphatidylglycerophosphate/cardiolipin synthase-like enzyme